MSNDWRSRSGNGAGGMCICVHCGQRQPHRPGSPCRDERCPQCGKAMLREGAAHHAAYLAREAKRGERAPADV
jgi:hypothetical protein